MHSVGARAREDEWRPPRRRCPMAEVPQVPTAACQTGFLLCLTTSPGSGRTALPTCTTEKVWYLKGMWAVSLGRRKSWGARLPRRWNMSSSTGVCRLAVSLKYLHSRLSRMRLGRGDAALSENGLPSPAPSPSRWRPPRSGLVSPELRVVHLDGHRVRRVVRVPERELEELGGAQGGADGVLRGDGQAQRAADALGLQALPVGGDDLQVPRVLCADVLLSLRDTGPTPGPLSCGKRSSRAVL